MIGFDKRSCTGLFLLNQMVLLSAVTPLRLVIVGGRLARLAKHALMPRMLPRVKGIHNHNCCLPLRIRLVHTSDHVNRRAVGQWRRLLLADLEVGRRMRQSSWRLNRRSCLFLCVLLDGLLLVGVGYVFEDEAGDDGAVCSSSKVRVLRLTSYVLMLHF